jgi:hypothetical protein
MIRVIISQADLEQIAQVIPDVIPQIEVVRGILSPSPQFVHVAYMDSLQWGKWEQCKGAQKAQARASLVRFRIDPLFS